MPFRLATDEEERTGRLEMGERRAMIERSGKVLGELREPNRFASTSRDPEHSAENDASKQTLGAIDRAVVHSARARRAAAYLN